ncbi:MAG: putative metal-dependent hydrolase [Bacteroidetes bacterium]|nr:putative metal-dependent hydrolase [Bacteroidota bacterium]
MTEQKNYIEAIERLPELLKNAVQGLSDSQLDTPVGEGKWTIRQIAHHIADANINAYGRMKLVATEQKPILKPYDQDQWAVLADGKNSPLEPTLILLEGLHRRWVIFLRALPEQAWTKEGIHLENGKISMLDVLRTYSNHGNSHLQQITNFRQKMNW